MDRETAKILLEVIDIVGTEAVENTVRVLPIYNNNRLYYQNLILDEEYRLVPPNNSLNALKRGQCAWNAMRNMLAPSIADAKKLAQAVDMEFAALADYDFYGMCGKVDAYSSIRFVPPLQRRGTLTDNPEGTTVITPVIHEGVVEVKTSRFDHRPEVSEAYRFALGKILRNPQARKACMEFLALAVFEDRTGKARPILHGLGKVGTGKSLLMKIATGCVGPKTTKALSTREDQRRWVYPDAQLLTTEESPDVEDNSRKDFWNLCKSISKTLNAKEWEQKHKTAVAFETGAYIIMATNDMPFAASGDDDIDNVIGITLDKPLKNRDLVMPDGKDAVALISDWQGMPYDFIMKDLREAYNNKNHDARFGMDIYKEKSYHDSEVTSAQIFQETVYKQLLDYCGLMKWASQGGYAVTRQAVMGIIGHGWDADFRITMTKFGNDIPEDMTWLRDHKGIPLKFLKGCLGRGPLSHKVINLFRKIGYDVDSLESKTYLSAGVEYIRLPESMFDIAPVFTTKDIHNMTGYMGVRKHGPV